MRSARRSWLLLLGAFVGVPAVFGAFNLVAYWVDNEPNGPKTTGVYLAFVIGGAIAISLVRFERTWVRVALTVGYAAVMAIALLFVSLWVGCANGVCL